MGKSDTKEAVLLESTYTKSGASQVVLVVKNLPANAGDTGDMGLIPGSGRSSGGGQGNPLQYSCLENPTDRAAWRATVHRVMKSWTRLSNWAHTHTTMRGAGYAFQVEVLIFKLLTCCTHWLPRFTNNYSHHQVVTHLYTQQKRMQGFGSFFGTLDKTILWLFNVFCTGDLCPRDNW